MAYMIRVRVNGPEPYNCDYSGEEYENEDDAYDELCEAREDPHVSMAWMIETKSLEVC